MGWILVLGSIGGQRNETLAACMCTVACLVVPGGCVGSQWDYPLFPLSEPEAYDQKCGLANQQRNLDEQDSWLNARHRAAGR
jgi:hypothetical protein